MACQAGSPLHAVTGLNVTFAWGPQHQKAFNEIKKTLIEATALAQPDSEGEFVLDTDASSLAISGILHQWQGPPGQRRLRPIVYGSKKPLHKPSMGLPSWRCMLLITA